VAAKSASPFTLALFKPVQRFFKSSSMEVSNVEDATGEQSHFMAICSKIFLILTGFFYITNKSSGGKQPDPKNLIYANGFYETQDGKFCFNKNFKKIGDIVLSVFPDHRRHLGVLPYIPLYFSLHDRFQSKTDFDNFLVKNFNKDYICDESSIDFLRDNQNKYPLFEKNFTDIFLENSAHKVMSVIYDTKRLSKSEIKKNLYKFMELTGFPFKKVTDLKKIVVAFNNIKKSPDNEKLVIRQENINTFLSLLSQEDVDLLSKKIEDPIWGSCGEFQFGSLSVANASSRSQYETIKMVRSDRYYEALIFLLDGKMQKVKDPVEHIGAYIQKHALEKKDVLMEQIKKIETKKLSLAVQIVEHDLGDPDLIAFSEEKKASRWGESIFLFQNTLDSNGKNRCSCDPGAFLLFSLTGGKNGENALDDIAVLYTDEAKWTALYSEYLREFKIHKPDCTFNDMDKILSSETIYEKNPELQKQYKYDKKCLYVTKMTHGLMTLDEEDPEKIKKLWTDKVKEEFKCDPDKNMLIRLKGLLNFLRLKSNKKNLTRNIVPLLKEFVKNNFGSNSDDNTIERLFKQKSYDFQDIDPKFYFGIFLDRYVFLRTLQRRPIAPVNSINNFTYLLCQSVFPYIDAQNIGEEFVKTIGLSDADSEAFIKAVKTGNFDEVERHPSYESFQDRWDDELIQRTEKILKEYDEQNNKISKDIF
jgi:hypothetical protein